MEKTQKREISLIILILALLATSACLMIYTQKIDGPPIRSDGTGYYAYLPSLFIEHDLKMNLSQENIANNLGLAGIAPYPATGKLLDKYPMGVAILQSPFFFVAHWLAPHLGYQQTGYTLPYQVANVFSGIFYLCLGAFFLLLSLLAFTEKKVAYLTLTLILFGTNVFHYGTYDAAFSHIYTFSLVSIYVWLLLQYQKNSDQPFSPMPFLFFGVILGFITITRVPNMMFGLPLLGLVIYKLILKKDWINFFKEAFFVAIAFSFILLPQLLYWHAVTGKFLVYAYQGEYFNWIHPEIYNFLFSLRKGLFVWAPLSLLAIAGLPLFAKKNRPLAILIGIVLCLQVYLCASWGNWEFGGSFGCRPFVDVMPFLALPLASFLCWLIAQKSLRFALSLAAFFIILNLIFMFLYWTNYIPPDHSDWRTFKLVPHHVIKLVKRLV